jgi:hypothetical protein
MDVFELADQGLEGGVVDRESRHHQHGRLLHLFL